MRESKRNKQRSRMKLEEREKTALQAREEDRQTEGGLGEKKEGEIQIKEREREMDNRERRAEERAQLLLYLQFPEALSTRTMEFSPKIQRVPLWPCCPLPRCWETEEDPGELREAGGHSGTWASPLLPSIPPHPVLFCPVFSWRG